MIIYKCIITGDEMFSDIYKITTTHDDIFYEVEGKMVTRSEQFDESSISANASAEDAPEATESSSVSGTDIVLNHKLQEMPAYDKKSYMAYIKDYAKMVKGKLQEEKPDRVEHFTKHMPAAVKHVCGNLKNFQFFVGESMNAEGSLGLLDFREDGVTPYMLFFKDGLVVEKC